MCIAGISLAQINFVANDNALLNICLSSWADGVEFDWEQMRLQQLLFWHLLLRKGAEILGKIGLKMQWPHLTMVSENRRFAILMLLSATTALVLLLSSLSF